MNELIIGYTWLLEVSIPGVPARDLSIDEYEIYKEAIELSERAHGVLLYAPVFAELEEQIEENE